MELTAEEAYLEELWREQNEEDQEPPALQQALAQQQHALPSYQELMGQGAGAITLRRTKAPTDGTHANGGGVSSPGRVRGSEGRDAGAGEGRAPTLGLGPSVGADVEQLKRRVAFAVQAVDGYQRRYDEVLLEANKATELVRSMEAEISSLQREAEELSRRLPPAPERQRHVTTWLEQRAAALDSQRGVQGAKQLELIAAEAALRAAERELEFLAEARGEVEAAAAAEAAEAGGAAAALRAREERAVAGYARRQAAEAARLAAVQADVEEAARKRVEAAQEAHAKAVSRLRSDAERIRDGVNAGREAVSAEAGRRRQAVLGLKASLEAVRADVARQAELAAVLQRQRRELQEREFGLLVEAGMNPYEVFRRREHEAEHKRQSEAVSRNIASRQMDLAAQLAKEQEDYQRALADRRRRKAEREAFDREMGVAARQARTDEYMRSHSVGGQSMLDPTGRIPFNPSEAVVVKTARFGGGGASPAVLSQQLGRLGRDTQPKPLLLPAKYRGRGGSGDGDVEAVAGLASSSRYDGSDDEGMGSPPRSPRPQSHLAMAQAAGGAGGGGGAGPAPAGGGGDRYRQLATRPLTKLETGLLEAAKARHKAAIGTQQTQMGRTFGGDAFLASPPVVEFRDFDVGRTVSATLQIINRSYKKNTFRVTGIPVEHCDVLDFSYDLPGYLAPGVSGAVTVSFTPKAAVDIDSRLQLLADTGPFEVPITCRAKRAQLAVSPAQVDFGGGVTLGDSATRTFTISNEGALEVEYRLDSPQLSDDERAMLKSSANLSHLLTSATVAAAAAAAASATGTSGSFARSARSFSSMMAAGDGAADAAAAATAAAAAASGPSVAPREERRLTHGGFTVFPCVGTLKGYSKVTFTVTFAPVIAETARLLLHVTYKAPSMKRLALPHHEVLITGVGRDVPIYLERPLIDFRCCMVGHTYRDVLQVRNGGKSAMKVTVVPRPELEGFFEFSPDFGFVQAGDSFPITIRFRPTLALLTACRRHVVEPAEEQVIEVAMRLSVPDQTLPVPFTLRAQLTVTDLVFEPPQLDFGDCVLSERTALRLRVTNPGRLPQTFGFVGLPGGLRVEPNDGYGFVLPGETLERLVSLQPPIAGQQSFALTVRSLAGRAFVLPCRANGLLPRLSMSSNVVRMPATPVGDTRTASVVLVNRTDAPQAYEFAVPPGADLSFSPHVGLVAPQSRQRVQIDYSPRPPEEGEQPSSPPPQPQPQADGAAADGGGADADADGDSSDGERAPHEWPALDSPGAGGVGRRRSSGAASGGGGGSRRHSRADNEAADGEDGDDEELDEPPSGLRGKPKAGGGGGGKTASPGRGRSAAAGSRANRSPSPPSAKKGPKAKIRIMADPEEDEDDDDGGQETDPAGQSRATAALSSSALNGGASSWYRYRDHVISCYIRPHPPPSAGATEAAAAAAGGMAAAMGGGGGPRVDGFAASSSQELHLQLSTCAVLPDLVLQTPLPYVELHQCFSLDFGPVPVGQRVLRPLLLANQGSEPLSLSTEPLDSREVFCVVNALRPVKPGGTFRLLLAFAPQARTEYLEVLCVSSARTRLRLALKGAGIAPELQLGPPDVTSTGLDFGDVLLGECASRTFSVTNVCPFPLSFSMLLQGRRTAADSHPQLRPPFAAEPAEGVLAQGESCEVTVTFSPASQRPYFEDALQVVVPNQQDQLLVPLRGRGWLEGVFVAGPEYPEPDPDPFQLRQLAAAAHVQLPPSVGAGDAAAAAAAAAVTSARNASSSATGGGSKPSTPGTPAGGKSKASMKVDAAAAAAAAAAATAAASSGIPADARVLTLTFPDSVYAGEEARASFDVGSLRSTVQGGAPGEVVLHELPAEARETGWALVEPAAAVAAAGGGGGGGSVKVALAAGERKTVTLSYTPPRVPHPGMAAAYGHAEYRTLRLGCTLRGGLPSLAGGPEGRVVVVLARCRLMPGSRPAGEPLPPSVKALDVEEAVEAAETGASASAGGLGAGAGPGTPPGKRAAAAAASAAAGAAKKA